MPPKPGGGGGGSSPLALSERRLDIGSLPPRDLVALRDQLEAESRSLAQRAMALQQVAAQFGGSGRAIEQLAEQKKGLCFRCLVLSICGAHEREREKERRKEKKKHNDHLH